MFQSRVLNNPASEDSSISQRDYPAARWISLSSRPSDSALRPPGVPRRDQGRAFPCRGQQAPQTLPKATASAAGEHHRRGLAASLLPASPSHPTLSGPAAREGDGRGRIGPRRRCRLRPAPLAWGCGFRQRGEMRSPQLHLGLIF